MKHIRLLPVLIAAGAAVPGIALYVLGVHAIAPPLAALVSGIAILGASFLLLWACDAAQADISQALALAVVALVAVLPEYAVDMYFTWQAGQNPASPYAQYAVANMTGANRLLIGVAWGAIALVFWARFRRPVRIGPERRLELAFLGAATAYAFVVPLKGSLAWYDGVVFLALYAWYIGLAARRPPEESEAIGPAAVIAAMPRLRRRVATSGLFVFAALAILANAERFCEGLIATGTALGINEFLLVQWLAPIASEAPEFVVALVFAWRGQANLALGSLLSSKLNQWTLLVGMIPGVFAVSHGALDHPIPMGSGQMSEILLTAAQSLLGVVLLSSLRLTLSGAALLFGLFVSQFALPGLVERAPSLFFGLASTQIHPVFSLLYAAAALALFLQRPSRVVRLFASVREKVPPVQELPCECGRDEALAAGDPESADPKCRECGWRVAAIEAGVRPKRI
jgi:cation:H+ antiporter